MLLLDEPFGALDARVRKELRAGLREIHDQTGLTTVFVTHDQDEAMELADLVVVMSMGRIEQIGTRARDPHPAGDQVRRGIHRHGGGFELYRSARASSRASAAAGADCPAAVAPRRRGRRARHGDARLRRTAAARRRRRPHPARPVDDRGFPGAVGRPDAAHCDRAGRSR